MEKRIINPASPGNKGFSLVELIIVIAIMAILAAAIAPALIRYIDKSRREDDVQTARNIGEALSLCISSGVQYTCGGKTQDMYEWYMDDSVGANEYTVQDDNGNTYDIVCIAKWVSGQNGNLFVNGGASEHDELVMEINETATPEENMIKCKKNPVGSSLDMFVVGRNKTDDRIEVWIGSSADSGNANGGAYFRLYPEPCPEYK